MKKRMFRVVVVLFVASPHPARAQGTLDAYNRLPLTFERNEGQAGPTADFVSRGRGYTLTLNSSRTVFLLASETLNRSDAKTKPAPRSLLSVQLLGADGKAVGEGLDEQPGRSNYFLGNDSRNWRTGITNYAKVRYRDVYPGVDLVYYGNRRELEHDFIVAPGADPTRIRLKFEGATRVSAAANGDLVLRSDAGRVFLRKPEVYQERGGAKTRIAGRYSIKGKSEVGFVLGRYDRTRPLIIDPVMSYATYLGGSGITAPNGIAVDVSGNAYVAGYTDSGDFPTTAGTLQPTTSRSPAAFGNIAFVTKFNASGTALLYSTFLGGNQDGSIDQGFGIAVDSSGNAYVTGVTNSPDFPTVGAPQPSPGGAPDAFVSKLDPTGSALLYSTYLGGSTNDSGLVIAVDSGGSAYVSGITLGGFPVVAAYQSTFPPSCPTCTDLFVAKLNATGSAVVFATYLGGTGRDWLGGMALDSASNVYLAGTTQIQGSFNVPYPTTPGAFQPTAGGTREGFVSKLSADGTTLLYSTFLGGAATTDSVAGIAVDSSGNAYITGETRFVKPGPSDFPTTPGAFKEASPPIVSAFVTKLNVDGSGLVYSTFLAGASCTTTGGGVTVNSSGNAWITGVAEPSNPDSGRCLTDDFPQTQDAFAPDPTDPTALYFVTKLTADGSGLMFSSRGAGGHGTRAEPGGFVGIGIGRDPEDNVYIKGLATPTAGAFQPLNPGAAAVVMRIADDHISPTTTATPSGTAGNAGWWRTDVTVGLLAADTPLGVGVKELTYSASGAQSVSATTVSGNSASPVISANGQTTVSFFAKDRADNVEASHGVILNIDKQAPEILCVSPDGVWHANDVSIACEASDAVSRLAVDAEQSFLLATSLAAGSESDNTPTGSRSVCDVAGNCATAGPIGGNRIDKKSPTISIAAPTATTYLLNQSVAGNYTCTDGGSGTASCTGTAANGANINTSSVGSNTFTVTAIDTVGNASTPSSVGYKVTYKVYPMYDPTKAFNAKGNATIKVQLENAAGANRSSSGVVVTAVRVSTPGDAAFVKTLSGNFIFDSTLTYQQSAPGGGYRYSLDPSGLAPGTYAFVFSVAGDPALHLLPLTIK